MTFYLILFALVVLVCVTSSKLLYRFGVPALLIFLVLGMLSGSDGIIGIQFNDYNMAEKACSLALVFIMFYGGFGTNWKMAKPIAPQAILMSTLGVLLTAVLTGLFSYLVLETTLLESLLLGAVVGSTDAASVFSILRSRKLDLKGGLSSLLEVESGSNDPCAYMMTMILLTFITGEVENIILMLFKQVGFGLLIGFGLAKLAVFLLKRFRLEIEGLYPIFVMAIAVLSYALSDFTGGNGYLSVYLTGIIIGNSKIPHKKSLVRFFDGISWIMQIMLFFMLGLLSFPSQLQLITGTGLLIALFMLFVARPAATFAILSWFKVPVKQQLFVSWVGLRGAASIVFAIMAITRVSGLGTDIFHIVFFIALFSVAVQGSLLPLVAKKLDLVDTSESVLKTFNDYEEELSGKLTEMVLNTGNPWIGQTLLEANIPEGILIVMIKRGKETIVPNGSTELCLGDVLVMNGADMAVQELFEQFSFQ